MSLPKDSPAAYAIAAVAGEIITIEASFATDPSGPTTVDIRADGGGVLGPIDPATITKGGGASVPEFVPVSLPHHIIVRTEVTLVALVHLKDMYYREPD
jgi:hypothetical protein